MVTGSLKLLPFCLPQNSKRITWNSEEKITMFIKNKQTHRVNTVCVYMSSVLWLLFCHFKMHRVFLLYPSHSWSLQLFFARAHQVDCWWTCSSQCTWYISLSVMPRRKVDMCQLVFVDNIKQILPHGFEGELSNLFPLSLLCWFCCIGRGDWWGHCLNAKYLLCTNILHNY